MTIVMVFFWGRLAIWSVQSTQLTCPYACQIQREIARLQGWNRGNARLSLQLLYQTASLVIAGYQPQEQNVRPVFPLDYRTLTRTAVVHYDSTACFWRMTSQLLANQNHAYSASTRILGCRIRDVGSEAAVAFTALMKNGQEKLKGRKCSAVFP